jgi:hypothetical protein
MSIVDIALALFRDQDVSNLIIRVIKYSNASHYDEKIMGIGRKIMAGIALIVAAMVVKRYMKKREKEEKKN